MGLKLDRLLVVTIILVLVSANSGFTENSNIKIRSYNTKTKDGWVLSVKRFLKDDINADNVKAAVILCHGFNINAKFWDLDKRSSFARFLANNDYDVWVPCLRGSGNSSKTFLANLRGILKFELTKMHRSIIRAPFNITKFSWTMDDHIYYDAPAIINLVRKKSGFDKLYWVGHSMGGTIMFAYLETEGQSKIAGFVPIASMMTIPDPLNPRLQTIANRKSLATASLIINTSMASRLRNLTFGIIKHPTEDLLIKKENMYSDVVRRFFNTAIDDTSPGIVSQFSNSLRAGEIKSADLSYSYTDNVKLVKVPILVIGTGNDGFMDEKSTRYAFDEVSSKDKDIVIFSKENGYSTDYGHCDLIIGKNSEKEVYPVISNWLDKQVAKKRWYLPRWFKRFNKY